MSRPRPLAFALAVAGFVGLFFAGALAAESPADSLAPESFATEPLLSEKTVVALIGLAGDVESERLYRGHLERLFEALAAADPPPRRVVLLVDGGAERFDVPPVSEDLGSILDVRVGNRRGVLALAEEWRDEGAAEGATPDVTVFAWGHGGTVGDDSVLHVRGPRVGVADLVALAEAASTARFVLFFRESGAFARAIRDPNRMVISSEEGTAFESDPIGLGLLLDRLRRRPDLGPVALAEAAGADIFNWYDEQRLARLEEPALWLADAEPRAVSREAALAAREGEPAAEVASSDPAPEPGEWRGPEPIDPATLEGTPLDPGSAGAVVLSRRVAWTLADTPAVVEEREEWIQIVSAEGEDWADVSLTYHPPGEKLRVLDATVRRADGTVLVVDPATAQEAAGEVPAGYSAPVRKILRFPEAEPGAILHLSTEREWRRYPLPHVPLQVPIDDPRPVLDAEIVVRVPRDRPLHWALHSRAARSGAAADRPPEISETTYGREHAWRFANIPARPREVLSAYQPPTLLVSTFPSWSEFAEWYRRLVRLADEPTPEIEALAAELTEGLDTPREKARALYDFVSGLRYVAIPLGVNSHRPHAAADVLQNRYGDCKDKANLLNTLLGTLGIEADLVLVPRFTQADPAVPGVSFNHAISRIRLGDDPGDVLFADATDEVARFGFLPPGDPGRRVLIIEPGADGLVELPQPSADDHRLELVGRIDLSTSPATASRATASFEAKSTGYVDYSLRQAARRASPGLPLLGTWLEPAAGVFELASQGSTDAKDLREEFRWRAEGRLTGGVASLRDRRLLRPPAWLPAAWRAALHDRETPLRLEDGYPLMIDQRIEILLPSGTAPDLPEPLAVESGPLRWRLEWRQADDTSLRFDLTLRLERAELDLDETHTFQESLRQLYEAMQRGVVF